MRGSVNDEGQRAGGGQRGASWGAGAPPIGIEWRDSAHLSMGTTSRGRARERTAPCVPFSKSMAPPLPADGARAHGEKGLDRQRSSSLVLEAYATPRGLSARHRARRLARATAEGAGRRVREQKASSFLSFCVS